MPPTPERAAASEALREQIMATAVATGAWTEGALLTDFVTVFAQQRYDDDGEPYTTIGFLMAGGQMPDYRIIGLLRQSLVLVEDHSVNGYRWVGDDTPD